MLKEQSIEEEFCDISKSIDDAASATGISGLLISFVLNASSYLSPYDQNRIIKYQSSQAFIYIGRLSELCIVKFQLPRSDQTFDCF